MLDVLGMGISTRARAGAIALLFVGCGGAARIPRASLPSVPTELARCKVASSESSPLVTEWPASEKANLEARIREGGVAVAYTGCAMRILPQCTLPGAYTWQRTTPAKDRLEIGNVDELYAKLPLGAVSLEGELERSGQLTMQTIVSGQFRLAGVTSSEVPDTGGCAAATHIVSGLAVGAFSLSAGGKLSGTASAEVVGTSAGATTSSEKSLLREAGDPARCSESTYDYPSADCASPIQVFLTPLPGRAAAEGPPGTVKVTFYSGSGDSTWEVISGKVQLCKTPCSQWIDPSSSLVMKLRRSWQRDDRVKVPNLRKHAVGGPLQVHARATQRGKLATGIMITVFASAAIITGVTLSAVDCWSDDPGKMCTGGAISAPAGVIGLVPGIWLMRSARARAEIVTNEPRPFGLAPTVEPAPSAPSVVFGPGFVAGHF